MAMDERKRARPARKAKSAASNFRKKAQAGKTARDLSGPSGSRTVSSSTGPVPGMGKVGSKVIARYTVKKGDTLSAIAKEYYGSGSRKYWELIQKANMDLIKDPNMIKPGQVFKIPELPETLKK